MGYIEREKAIAYAPLPKHLREYQTMNLDDAWEDGYDFAIRQIESIPAADVRPVVQRDAVMQALNNYFSIGDSYTYELNRVKEAFYVGTMTFDDFEEWNEDNVSDLCDYLMKELFCPNCGGLT